jgi:hypothetical protein
MIGSTMGSGKEKDKKNEEKNYKMFASRAGDWRSTF